MTGYRSSQPYVPASGRAARPDAYHLATGFDYDWLRFKRYLGNVGSNVLLGFALAEIALLVLRKKASAMGGRRGRMIDRQTAIALINEAITAGARRAKACAALEISEPCGAGRKAVRFGLISVLSCHARNRPTSSARPNALPCWRPVIQRNFPACHQVRSCLTWPIKGYIWPRNRVSTAFSRWAAASPRPCQACGAAQTTHQHQACAPCQVWTWDITWI